MNQRDLELIYIVIFIIIIVLRNEHSRHIDLKRLKTKENEQTDIGFNVIPLYTSLI